MLSCLIQLIQLARLKPYGKLEGEDFREGLTAILSVKVAEPQFEGQTKTKLGNGDIKGIVDKVVYEGILDFLEQNPSIGRKVIEKALLAARSRSAAKKARELIRRKSALGGSSLPGKLADCSNRDPKALQKLSKATPTRSTLPILGCVLIDAGDEKTIWSRDDGGDDGVDY